jgi:hypothetical protein
MSVACVELGCQDASYWFPLPTKSIEILLAHKLHWRKYSGHSPIGESHKGILAKLQWTLANWRKSWGYIGESKVDFRHWRKYSGHSPIGESHKGILAKLQWTLPDWRKSGKPKLYVLTSPICKISIFTIKTSNSSRQRNGISTTSHKASIKQTVENERSPPDNERVSLWTSSPRGVIYNIK